MKVFVILLLAGFAGAVGYLVGTESGSRRRDDLINRIRRESSGPTVDLAEAAGPEATGSVGEATQQLSA